MPSSQKKKHCLIILQSAPWSISQSCINSKKKESGSSVPFFSPEEVSLKFRDLPETSSVQRVLPPPSPWIIPSFLSLYNLFRSCTARFKLSFKAENCIFSHVGTWKAWPRGNNCCLYSVCAMSCARLEYRWPVASSQAASTLHARIKGQVTLQPVKSADRNTSEGNN